jgi:hypothetical protein
MCAHRKSEQDFYCAFFACTSMATDENQGNVRTIRDAKEQNGE